MRKDDSDWKKIEEIDFNTARKIEDNVGKELMDIDGIAYNLMSNIKGVSTEMEYRIQLDMNTKIYTIMMVIGMLMILTVILFLF